MLLLFRNAPIRPAPPYTWVSPYPCIPVSLHPCIPIIPSACCLHGGEIVHLACQLEGLAAHFNCDLDDSSRDDGNNDDGDVDPKAQQGHVSSSKGSSKQRNHAANSPSVGATAMGPSQGMDDGKREGESEGEGVDATLLDPAVTAALRRLSAAVSDAKRLVREVERVV